MSLEDVDVTEHDAVFDTMSREELIKFAQDGVDLAWELAENFLLLAIPMQMPKHVAREALCMPEETFETLWENVQKKIEANDVLKEILQIVLVRGKKEKSDGDSTESDDGPRD